MKKLLNAWNRISLVNQIIIGLIIGIALALLVPKQLSFLSILGDLFVGALKSLAPLLVLFLVAAAISQHRSGQKTNMGSIIALYFIGTFLAGLTAVLASFLFPIKLTLTGAADAVTPPGGLGEVLHTLLQNLVDNPVHAIINANYIGILFWAVLFGLALKHVSEPTRKVVSDLADVVSQSYAGSFAWLRLAYWGLSLKQSPKTVFPGCYPMVSLFCCS